MDIISPITLSSSNNFLSSILCGLYLKTWPIEKILDGVVFGRFGRRDLYIDTQSSKLVANGLLIRTVDETDRRACQLRLAEPTQQIVDASRAARRALLAEVLGELDDNQIDSLTKGLEVLDTVARRLQER